MTERKTLLFALLFTSFILTASAETFRIRKTSVVNLGNDTVSESTVRTGINDGIAVFLPKDRTYIEGIELKIQIPKIVSEWRDCVAFSIYDGISPRPESGQIDYEGKKIYVTPLPQQLNWILQIPLEEENSIKNSSYVTKINILPAADRGFTFFRFQPAMKGVPDETYKAELSVTVKPVLKNLGELVLSIRDSNSEKVPSEIYIDDKPVVLKNDRIYLEPGVHNLSVQNTEFRNEFRSIVIEQAKTTEVNLTLRSNEPVLKITAPQTAQLFLDSTPVSASGKELTVTEGEHTIRCLLGGYEMIRTLNIMKGKTYSVNLVVDMEITEE